MTELIAAIAVLAGLLIGYNTAVIALSYVCGTVWNALGRWQAMLAGRVIPKPMMLLSTVAVPEAPVRCCCTAGAGA